MGSCWSKVQPSDSDELRNLNRLSSYDSDDFNPNAVKRSCTDILFLALMACAIVGLAGALTYAAINGNVFRIINGYDYCGNICGRTNTKYTGSDTRLSCKGEDKTADKYLLEDNGESRKRCVNSCSAYPGLHEFLNRCIPEATEKVADKIYQQVKTFFEEVAEDLHMCWREIIYMCMIAFVFSIIIMILMRFFVGIVVWVVLIGVVLASCAGTAYLWIMWHTYKESSKSDKQSSYLAFAILASIVTICVCLIILVMRKRIQLVVQLFKEAGKSIASMPLLLVEPLLTVACLLAVLSLWLYSTILIESAGYLAWNENKNCAEYKKDTLLTFSRWYNLLCMLWLTQFIIGCQHMVLAGAVSTWFFTRNKQNLDSPISKSFHNLVRYHLGTVSIGAFFIALVQFVRVILMWISSILKKYDNVVCVCLSKCCQCCLACFECILKYVTRNAYILTATFGYPFCRAGKQAFKLLTSNALRVVAINSVGDFVLLLGKVLVVMATVLIGIEILRSKEGVSHVWVPLTLAGLFAYLVSHCFLTVYEMAIDTIFLCFCEDCEQNDGLSKPYYMSRELMQFVENSRKALEALDKHEATEGAPNTISSRVR